MGDLCPRCCHSRAEAVTQRGPGGHLRLGFSHSNGGLRVTSFRKAIFQDEVTERPPRLSLPLRFHSFSLTNTTNEMLIKNIPAHLLRGFKEQTHISAFNLPGNPPGGYMCPHFGNDRSQRAQGLPRAWFRHPLHSCYSLTPETSRVCIVQSSQPSSCLRGGEEDPLLGAALRGRHLCMPLASFKCHKIYIASYSSLF